MGRKIDLPADETQSNLMEKITCPHCWHSFDPIDVLWVAASPELLGDFRLGESEPRRFLPSRFDLQGRAVDEKGFSCKELACPHCHLDLPFPLLEMPSSFISIVGAPASGKSYFLAAMTSRLRKILPQKFCLNFIDADPKMNLRLIEYESAQFQNDDENAVVKIEKTQEQGDLYNTVLMDDQRITYPQPFVFAISPLSNHVHAEKSRRLSMSLALYDNAGESYLPVQGADRTTLPVTRHLGKSNSIFFLFDPLQDSRFRALCRSSSSDPQLEDDPNGQFRKSPVRQDMILAEMIRRTRLYRNMSSMERYPNPVVVVVTKLDAWKQLLPNVDFQPPWSPVKNTEMYVLRKKRIQTVSDAVRKLFHRNLPEIIGMVEQFASDVTYIPVSATGAPPIVDPATHENGFRNRDIKPLWAEIPVLYALARFTRGNIMIAD